MENESRLKRFSWSAAATAIAAAIWLPSPFGELFFFPRQQLLQDKILFAASFLAALCILLFLFGNNVRTKNLLLVLFMATTTGLAVSFSLLAVHDLYFCYTTNKWWLWSSMRNAYSMIYVFTWASLVRGTFALAAFTALVYRYLPKLIDFIRSKYHARQSEGATRGE